MTRSTTRRAATALLAGLAAAALASGCSAGQIAETASKRPSVTGANAEVDVRGPGGERIGQVSVRDAVIVYRDSRGYPAGGTAPLALSVFNDTPTPVTVRVRPDTAAPDGDGRVEVTGVRLVRDGDPEASPTPSAAATASPDASAPAQSPTPSASASPRDGLPASTSASPAAPATPDASATASPSPGGTAGQGPASFTIPAHGFVTLRPGATGHLALEGLGERLAPGRGVALLFEFSNGARLRLTPSVGVPLSPAPRATPSLPAGDGEAGGH